MSLALPLLMPLPLSHAPFGGGILNDAWKRISENLENTPIEELKSKKKSLIPATIKKEKSISTTISTSLIAGEKNEA
ncbi:hypothetical protein JTB14_033827 [Gonioctena quinquepunctata]|nr:hypothetical protein JTB14_033827 [Gonioctena quinquepunctata]